MEMKNIDEKEMFLFSCFSKKKKKIDYLLMKLIFLKFKKVHCILEENLFQLKVISFSYG